MQSDRYLGPNSVLYPAVTSSIDLCCRSECTPEELPILCSFFFSSSLPCTLSNRLQIHRPATITVRKCSSFHLQHSVQDTGKLGPKWVRFIPGLSPGPIPFLSSRKLCSFLWCWIFLTLCSSIYIDVVAQNWGQCVGQSWELISFLWDQEELLASLCLNNRSNNNNN